jgi:hypothetical protein
MTDAQARAAQQALRTIRQAHHEATLSGIETTAAIDGWLHLVKHEIEAQRAKMKRGRR